MSRTLNAIQPVSRFFGAIPELDVPENQHQEPESNVPCPKPGCAGLPEIETPFPRSRYPLYSDLIGNTPMVDLSHLLPERAEGVRVLAKCEFFNPGFSVKDRIVRNILDRAEQDGALPPNGTVVAASSGNTGAATAMMCAMRGYRCIVTTSSKCSKEKMDAIRAYGAELLVSPPGVKEGDPDHYMEMAKRLCLENEGWFDVNQYDSKRNPEGHYLTLGPEVWHQTDGDVTHFIVAGSTGGTISGTGRFLKEMNPNVEVVLADPVGSVFTNYYRTGELGVPKKFLVEGVGKGSIPGAMDLSLVDDVLPVSDQDAFDMCSKLARTEGLCVGGSAGLNVHAALELAKRQTKPCTIVTIMCDLGVKYLSKVYNDEWLLANNFQLPSTRLSVSPELHAATGDKSKASGELSSTEATRSSTYRRYSDLIGNTPLVDLSHLLPERAEGVRVLAKCEFFNPGFSVKDRIVRNILDRAEQDGALPPNGTVVAASSGNTGAATAMMCAMRGYRCIVTTSSKCSKEKMDAIRAYGAELLVSPPGVKEGDPDHYMEMAKRLCLENEGWFDVNQYDSKRNPEGHYLTLGPEVWHQTDGDVTHFIVAGSTGGTISGTGRFLKEMNPNVEVVLADPVGSVFTNYYRTGELGVPKKFLVEGVGKGSIPGAMDLSLVDDVLPVSDQDAFDMCSKLARTEGLCVGGSAGLNVHAALELAKRQTKPCTIVTIMCDLGVKYLSKVYNDEWLLANNLKPPQGRQSPRQG